MDEAEKKRTEIRIAEFDADGSERPEEANRRGATIVQPPDSWTVFGRPTRRLFRVNCRYLTQ